MRVSTTRPLLARGCPETMESECTDVERVHDLNKEHGTVARTEQSKQGCHNPPRAVTVIFLRML